MRIAIVGTGSMGSGYAVINGAVVDLSDHLGFEAPYNATLCAILRERESRFRRLLGPGTAQVPRSQN